MIRVLSVLYVPFVLFLALAPLTPQAVANRCKGEFSEPRSLIPCACSVYNRLLGGWRSDKVLGPYHAPDARASAADAATVAAVLAGETACLPVWFMYSYQDTVKLGIDKVKPVLTVTRGRQEVRFFERWFRKR